MPFSRYEESDHHAHLVTLHDEALEVDLKYVAIENLIKQMFSTQHAWTPPTWTTGSRYQYAPPLHVTLFQSEPPYERVGKAMRIVKPPPSSEPPYERRGKELRIIESPPKIQLKDLDEETELDSLSTSFSLLRMSPCLASGLGIDQRSSQSLMEQQIMVQYKYKPRVTKLEEENERLRRKVEELESRLRSLSTVSPHVKKRKSSADCC